MLVPILLLAIGSQAPFAADTSRGSYLFESCKALLRVADNTERSNDSSSANYCIGYVTGFTDAGALTNTLCLPDATSGTIARVYVRYMEENPKLLDSPALIGFQAAMRGNYHCSK